MGGWSWNQATSTLAYLLTSFLASEGYTTQIRINNHRIIPRDLVSTVDQSKLSTVKLAMLAFLKNAPRSKRT
jgi:hypothetical protein